MYERRKAQTIKLDINHNAIDVTTNLAKLRAAAIVRVLGFRRRGDRIEVRLRPDDEFVDKNGPCAFLIVIA